MSECRPQVAAAGQRVLAFDSSEVPQISSIAAPRALIPTTRRFFSALQSAANTTTPPAATEGLSSA
jgi:hypothetical protein